MGLQYMKHLPACRDLETASDSATLEQALEQLKKSKRKLLPVVNSQGHLVGMTSPSYPLSASEKARKGAVHARSCKHRSPLRPGVGM
jgi:CBS-domain-containing membrane protein